MGRVWGGRCALWGQWGGFTVPYRVNGGRCSLWGCSSLCGHRGSLFPMGLQFPTRPPGGAVLYGGQWESLFPMDSLFPMGLQFPLRPLGVAVPYVANGSHCSLWGELRIAIPHAATVWRCSLRSQRGSLFLMGLHFPL